MREFRLAGLLRLRKLQEDVAASELSNANRKLHDNKALQSRVRRNIAGMEDTAATAAQLRALAAARAAQSSLLLELDGAQQRLRIEVEHAQDAHVAAKTQSRTLEKLDEKHTNAQTAEDLRTEQNALDEIRKTTR